MWLDEQLDWTYHCSTVLSKIKRNSHLLRASSNYLSTQALKLLYYAQVQSHVQYGLLAWGNQCKESKKTMIQKELVKCWRLIAKGNTTNKNNEMNFLTFKNLVTLENLKMGFKIQTGQVPTELAHMINCDNNNKPLRKSHTYPTREKKFLNIPRHNTDAYHRSFLIAITRDYTSLPHAIAKISSLSTFIKHCKKHLLPTTTKSLSA